ncbi:exodeoxyribonuclease VII large subunit [Ammoniphilus oxalaticus]|uniref:Exodeoxyribonuclease 7 large subunit n=1 Tax=Ammoniphilus oxalaticus TaxID=66863 RepID=A0A419SMR4_9BACL|nr:exodeoxyribonuclease VII large subunit [Ammoniphilus oxalaticus]RKD25584.1 exodeoxyribonuclease VII large subunit [Ammoniphilus oxalaticus]
MDKRIFSVGDINRYLKHTLETDDQLQNVWVRAEISNFTHHSRGHMYFTLKDEDGVLKAVMFAGSNRYLKFIPKNGTKVLARGNITVYEQGGQYQLIAREMQPDGIGSLYLAFEQLKKKLEEEGLFKQDIKKQLPVYPKAIGVITSPTGAAIRDIITTLRRRYPLVRIILLPVLVQGDQAPQSISDAIELMNRSEFIDVLIVGRGGGSIEELWAFNTELVARSIFESDIPVISAVGHETDYTIADFAADMRAATPTAAAELAVPHIAELRQKLNWLEEKLQKQFLGQVVQLQERWDRAHRTLLARHPRKQVETANQTLDRTISRLQMTMQRFVSDHQMRRQNLTQRLAFQNPRKQLQSYRERLERTQSTLTKIGKTTTEPARNRWLYAMTKLDGLSPLKIMGRGYSLVYKDKQLVKSIDQLDPGDGLKVELMDGAIDCSVWAIEERENDGKK